MTSTIDQALKYLVVLSFLVHSLSLGAQELTPSGFINLISKQKNQESAEGLISQFSNKGRIPYTQGDSCLFIYIGKADKVEWAGDFNAWSQDTSFNNSGHLIRENIWVLKAAFPTDARLDYKIIVDGNWILDPVNPYQQWSGLGGPNSELRMPAWEPEPYVQKRENIEQGSIEEYSISSEHLGRKVAYRVYYPFDYEMERSYPLLYFTDGPEYADDRMGASITILDNLIQDKKIPSLIAVFLDPRDTDNIQMNYRMEDYALNEKFLEFFLSELIPSVEDSILFNYQEVTRAIIGTSLGGLNAAYFGIMAPEIFPLLGIQSPAFWFKPEIFDLYRSSDYQGSNRIYMSTGVINDTEDAARMMFDVLKEKNYLTHYREFNQGHSWGNWKSQLDDMLQFLLADYYQE